MDRKILSKIGEGDNGVVYEVDTLHGVRAVKELKSAPNELASIILALSQLHHPNIVDVQPYQVGKSGIEMERVGGVSVGDILLSRGALPQEICVAVGIMICNALIYAHEHSIMHLNLKPNNILIQKNGNIKICDFCQICPLPGGLSKVLSLSVARYCPPEVLFGGRADMRSDLFSVGCILYEMICGKKVFWQEDKARLQSVRKANRFTPLNMFQVRVNRKLRNLIDQCLCLSVNRRPQSVQDVLKRLQLIYTEMSSFPPQEAVEYFVNVTQGRVVIPRAFSIKPVLPILALIVVAFFLLTRPNKKNDQQDHINQVLFSADTSGAVSEWDSSVQKNKALPLQTSHKDSSNTSPLPITNRHANTSPEKAASPVSIKVPAKANGVAKAVDTVSKSEKKQIPAPKKPVVLEDLLSKMAAQVELGNYAQVLRIYEMLSGGEQESVRGLLLKMKALAGIGDKAQLSKFFAQNDLPDKEFYCTRGLFLFQRKRYEEALRSFQKCRSFPALISDSHYLERTALFYIASINTRFYLKSPSEKLRKVALESWFDVKYGFRNNSDHTFFQKAQNAIRHLSSEQK